MLVNDVSKASFLILNSIVCELPTIPLLEYSNWLKPTRIETAWFWVWGEPGPSTPASLYLYLESATTYSPAPVGELKNSREKLHFPFSLKFQDFF